jgi:hypothetical protein
MTPGSFVLNIVFALFSIMLTTLLSAEAEVSWANRSHLHMWAEMQNE